VNELVNYWRDMSKAWEDQANRNSLLRAEAEQSLAASQLMVKEL
jgi:hypothetical protein